MGQLRCARRRRSIWSRRPSASSSSRCAIPQQLAFVTQTTLSVDDTAAVVEALRAALSRDRRRRATRTSAMPRRTARTRCKKLLEQCDVLLVVGSPNSSNSNRLRELADRSRACRATWSTAPADIKPRMVRRTAPRSASPPAPRRRKAARARGGRAACASGARRRCASSTASPRTSRSRCRKSFGSASSPDPAGRCLPLVREILPSTQTRLVPPAGAL